MRGLKEGLFWPFALVSLAVMGLLALLLSLSLGRSIQAMVLEHAVAEAVDVQRPLVISQLEPQDLEQPMTGERYDRFHRFFQETVASLHTARIKVWNPKGMVIYSDDRSQAAQNPPAKLVMAAYQSLTARPKEHASLAESSPSGQD